MADSLYTLLDAGQTQRDLGCWARRLDGFTDAVGYSALGHIFLLAPLASEFAVLHPFRQALKNYGEFPDIEAFEASVLQESGFQEYVLRPNHVAALKEALGPLFAGHIYIPCPYPFLGGSEEVGTYATGDVWVFLEIVGRSHGY